MTQDNTISDLFEAAASFDLSLIKQRYKEEQSIPDKVVEEHFEELMKFLVLCAATNKHYGMRGPIDECWHTFVVFTKLYYEFCEKLRGSLIHHYPNTNPPGEPKYSLDANGKLSPDDDGRTSKLRKAYIEFLEDYQRAFNMAPPAHLWPRPISENIEGYASAGCACGCSCGCRCIA